MILEIHNFVVCHKYSLVCARSTISVCAEALWKSQCTAKILHVYTVAYLVAASDENLGDCRGLFERHKLLLSLQMCVRILESAHQVNSEEWQFFLKGGQVLDRSQQPPNPAPAWMSGLAWDNITQLDNLPNFKVLWAHATFCVD